MPAGFTWPVFETAVPEDETVSPAPWRSWPSLTAPAWLRWTGRAYCPKRGWLSFFYELGSQRWGYDPKDAGCARVYWFDGAPLAPAGFPVDLPEDAVLWEGNGHYYKVFSGPNSEYPQLTWEEAKLACEQLGGHLVTITSSEEQDFIESLDSTTCIGEWSVWIG